MLHNCSITAPSWGYNTAGEVMRNHEYIAQTTMEMMNEANSVCRFRLFLYIVDSLGECGFEPMDEYYVTNWSLTYYQHYMRICNEFEDSVQVEFFEVFLFWLCLVNR